MQTKMHIILRLIYAVNGTGTQLCFSSESVDHCEQQHSSVDIVCECVRWVCSCCNASLLSLLWGCYCTTNLLEHFPDYNLWVSSVRVRVHLRTRVCR